MEKLVFNPQTRFLQPEKVLFQTGLKSGQNVADLGAGSGFYALASGKIVGSSGKVYVVDILPSALDHVVSQARLRNISNLQTIRCDLEKPESCEQIPSGSIDLVIFANILHQIKNRKNLFEQAYALMRTGGKLLIIDWNDTPSPIGPIVSERISELEVAKLALESNLKSDQTIETDTYHYCFLFIK